MTAEALRVRIIESRRIASSLRGKEVIKKGGRLTTRVFLVRENEASLSENRKKKGSVDVISPALKETNNGASERTLEKEENRMPSNCQEVRNTRTVLFQGEYEVRSTEYGAQSTE